MRCLKTSPPSWCCWSVDKYNLCHFHLVGNCLCGSCCTYGHSWAEWTELRMTKSFIAIKIGGITLNYKCVGLYTVTIDLQTVRNFLKRKSMETPGTFHGILWTVWRSPWTVSICEVLGLHMRSSGLFIMANMHLQCEVEDLDIACTYMDRQQTEFV